MTDRLPVVEKEEVEASVSMFQEKVQGMDLWSKQGHSLMIKEWW